MAKENGSNKQRTNNEGYQPIQKGYQPDDRGARAGYQPNEPKPVDSNPPTVQDTIDSSDK